MVTASARTTGTNGMTIGTAAWSGSRSYQYVSPDVPGAGRPGLRGTLDQCAALWFGLEPKWRRSRLGALPRRALGLGSIGMA